MVGPALVGHVEVDQAITVHIGEGCALAETIVRHPRFYGDIDELLGQRRIGQQGQRENSDKNLSRLFTHGFLLFTEPT